MKFPVKAIVLDVDAQVEVGTAIVPLIYVLVASG